ncbi:hypothetical protein M885DRAFT_527667 [Pelagophyceae sp. CCMP2097]|nr:hypothetical protein M885DRAFT_527667 [Pelagophyceae sp. CCMP2097]
MMPRRARCSGRPIDSFNDRSASKVSGGTDRSALNSCRHNRTSAEIAHCRAATAGES